MRTRRKTWSQKYLQIYSLKILVIRRISFSSQKKKMFSNQQKGSLNGVTVILLDFSNEKIPDLIKFINYQERGNIPKYSNSRHWKPNTV